MAPVAASSNAAVTCPTPDFKRSGVVSLTGLVDSSFAVVILLELGDNQTESTGFLTESYRRATLSRGVVPRGAMTKFSA